MVAGRRIERSPPQPQADENRAGPKQRLLEENRVLHDAVNSGLEQKWSPKQISKRLRQDFPDDDTMRVSHETIYQRSYLQARGELRTQLKLALRHGRTRRVNRSRTTVATGKILDMVNISERPVEADDRAVPGFWEGDLIIGKGWANPIWRPSSSVQAGMSCSSGSLTTAPPNASLPSWPRKWKPYPIFSGTA